MFAIRGVFCSNNNLSKVNVYVGSDSKIHFVNSAGADSVLNFRDWSASCTILYDNAKRTPGMASETYETFSYSVSQNDVNSGYLGYFIIVNISGASMISFNNATSYSMPNASLIIDKNVVSYNEDNGNNVTLITKVYFVNGDSVVSGDLFSATMRGNCSMYVIGFK